MSGSYYTHCITSFSLTFVFAPFSLVGKAMSPKRQKHSKRSSVCPGCHLPQADHGFGNMHKRCGGPPSNQSDVEEEIGEHGASGSRHRSNRQQTRPGMNFSKP